MRDHVLLQAIARVNRPYIDPEGNRKRVGLVVDFVGVLRELRKALQFDSSDVSGAIEGLDELLRDFLKKIDQAKSDYLEEPSDGADDERLEQVVYGRFLDPENRKVFFDAYKEIEALWEILSPSAELRGQHRHVQATGPALCGCTECLHYQCDLRGGPCEQDQPDGAGAVIAGRLGLSDKNRYLRYADAECLFGEKSGPTRLKYSTL